MDTTLPSADSQYEESSRLNKYLASCGVGSRRKCDQLIQSSEVIVNGKVCTDLSSKVSDEDFVKIDNKRVVRKEIMTILFNKPRGCVCTKNDELKRDTIYEYIPPNLRHLNHVGRLDQDSEGLLILTNDGDLAQKLAHPSLSIEKEYLVTVNQAYGNEALDQMLKGIFMGTGMGRGKAKSVKRLSPRRLLVVLETGTKRQIRMMCKVLHLNVIKLVRIRIGSVVTSGLESGRWTELGEEDIEMLQINPKSAPNGYRTKPNKISATGYKGVKNATKTTGRRTGKEAPRKSNKAPSSSNKPYKHKNKNRSK